MLRILIALVAATLQFTPQTNAGPIADTPVHPKVLETPVHPKVAETPVHPKLPAWRTIAEGAMQSDNDPGSLAERIAMRIGLAH